MFSLLNRLFSRIFDRLTGSKKVVAVGLMMAVGLGGIWAANYTDRDKTINANWTANNIWKRQTGAYIDTTSYPNSSSDNLYLTAKNTTKLTLTENVELSEFIVAYSGWTAGTSEITIDLAGYTLTCDKLTLNDNDSAGVKLTFIDSSAGKTGSVTTRVLDYSDNQNHSLKINDVPFTVTTTYNARAAAGTGKLTIEGTGTLTLPAAAANDPGLVPPAVSSVTWNGGNGTDWADPANWTGITFISQLKGAATVTIPSGLTNYPSASAATPVTLDGDLVIADGASVIFAGTTVLNTVTSPDGVITTGTDALTINGTASLKQLTPGSGATIIANDDFSVVTLSCSAAAGDTTKLKFNQGTGTQITTITNLSFNGAEFDFGNDTTDEFHYAGNLDLSSTATVNLAGTISTDLLTLAGTPSQSGAVTLFDVNIADDLTLADSVNFNGNVNASAAGKNLSITGDVNLAGGKAIGNAATKINDITITGNYTGLTGTANPISCDGDFTINGAATFRGDIHAKTITVTKDLTFGGNCGEVVSQENQDYGASDSSTMGVTFWRNTYPVQIYSTSNGTITFHTNLNSNDATGKPVKFGSISAVTNLTPNKIVFKKKIGNENPLGEITVNGILETSDSISCASIACPYNETISLGGNVTTTANYTGETASQIYGGPVTLTSGNTFNAGTNTVQFDKTVNSNGTAKNLKIGVAGKATAVVFKSDVGTTSSLAAFEFHGPVTIENTVTDFKAANWNNAEAQTVTPGTGSTVTITGNITGDNTFNNLTIAGTGTSTISGSNTVNGDFTCTAAGKTISFGAGKTQTVDGKFTITGTQANPITLNSTTADTQWNIKTPVDTAKVSFAEVKDSASTNASIKPLYSTTLGNNTNWIFAGKYRWLSTATGTGWTTAANWQIESGAGNWITASTYPGQTGDEDVVSIVANTNSKYPEFAGASGISISSINIAAGTSVSLNSTFNIILTAASDQITNKGTVIFKNSGRFIDTAATANYLMDTAQGTVEYSGSASTVTNFGSGGDPDYNNLVVKSSCVLESGHQIKVNGNLTTTAAITGGQSLYVAGTSSIGANITTEHNQEYVDAVTFTSGTVQLKATAASYKTIFDSTLTGIAAGTALTLNDAQFGSSSTLSNISTLTAGAVVNNGTITTSGAQTYNGLVSGTGTVNVPDNGVVFKGGFECNTLIGSTTSNPNIEFAGGDVTLTDFTVNGDKVNFKNANALKLTTNGQAFANVAVEYNATGSVTIQDSFKCNGLGLRGTLNGGSGTTLTVTTFSPEGKGTFNPDTSTVKVKDVKIVTNASNPTYTGSTDFYNLEVTGELNGDHTIENLTVKGTGETKITGSNTIKSFTCNTTSETAGKTITFTAGTKQTINSAFTITGSAAKIVTLQSSTAGTPWLIDTTGASSTVTGVKVQDSKSTVEITAASSLSLGGNTNWIIAGNYLWTGTTDADWDNSSNWKILQLDGTTYSAASTYPGEENEVDTVSIDTSKLEGNKKYPEKSTAGTIADLTVGGSAADTDATLTISGTDSLKINAASPSITNYGKIIYSNTGRITDNAITPKPIMDTANGTVQFEGTTSTVDNIADGTDADYNNLIINTEAALQDDIAVAGALTTTKAITGGKTLSVTGTSSIGGSVTTTGAQTYTDAVTLTANGSFIAGADTVTFSGTVKGKTAGTYSLTIGNGTNATKTSFAAAVSDITTLTVYGTTANAGTITTSGAQTYNGAVTGAGTINVPSLAAGTSAVTFNAGYTGGTLTGSTTTNPDIVFAGGTVKLGTFTHNDDVVLLKNTISSFDSNSKTLKDITVDVSSMLTIKSPLTANDVTFKNGNIFAPQTLTAANINIDGGSITAANNSTITVSGNWNHTAGTFSPATSTVKVTGNVSGTNIFNNLEVAGDLNGSHTITTLTINGTAGSASAITGNNSIGTFNCSTDSKTLTFTTGTKQTVTTKLNITGAATKEITLQSDTPAGKWDIDVSTVAAADKIATGVLVKNSTADATTITASASKSLGGNTNWIIAQKFVWTGNSSTAWTTPANWNVDFNGTQVAADDYPGAISTADTVTIGTITAGKSEPTFSNADTASITIQSLNISEAARKLTVSGTGDIKISDTTDPVTNKGTVIYSNKGRIKNTAATPVPIMDTANGTVQFEGTATAIDNIADGADDYNNLIVNSNASLASDIKTKGTFTLNTGASITGNSHSFSVGGASTLTGNVTGTSSQSYKAVTLKSDVILESGTGTVTIGATNSDAAAPSRSLTIGSAANATNLTFNGAIGATQKLNELTVYGKLESNTGAITCNGDLTVNDEATFRGAVTANSIYIEKKTTVGSATKTITATGTRATYGAQYFNGEVGINGNTEFKAPGQTVTFNSTLDSYNTTDKYSATITGNAVFNSKIGSQTDKALSALTVTGTATLGASCTNITTTTTQDYKDNVNFAGPVTLSGTVITVATDKNFASTAATPAAFTLAAGTFNFGTGSFKAGTLTVNSGASFNQTGDNGANDQTVTGLVNNGTMIWDSASNGGSLNVGAGGISHDTTDDSHLIVFNNKNVNFPDNATISGIFYNLTIPAGKTITNGHKIAVRNNLTINGTYTHNNKDLVLGTITVGPAGSQRTYATGPDGIITGTIASPATELVMGAVTINQNAKTKTFKDSVHFTTLTCQDTTAAGIITFEQNLKADNDSTITTKGPLVFASTATNGTSHTTEFTKGVTIGNGTNKPSLVTIGGTFKTNSAADANITIASPVKLSVNTIFTTNKGSITLDKVEEKTADTATLTINPTSGAITLNNAVSVKELTITNPTSLAIQPPSGSATVTAKDGFTLTGNGTVTLAKDSAPLTISTTSKNISFNGASASTGTVTLKANITLSTGTGAGDVIINQPFNGTAADTNSLTITAGTGDVNLKSDIGKITSLGATAVSGKKIILDSGKTLKAITVEVTASDDKTDAANPVKGIFRLNTTAVITATDSFSKKGDSLSQIAGTITVTEPSAATAISFNNDTYIDNAATIDAGTKNIVIGNGTTGDLYISALNGAAAQSVNFTAGTLDVKGNIALFNGNVSLNANMTSGKDIVLLKGTASTMYDLGGIDDLIAYINTLRKPVNNLCSPSLASFPTSMPDGTTVIGHTEYKSDLTDFGGKTIKSGQNFYDNGVKLSPASDWTLSLKENDDAKKSFAEAYNITIKNCKTVTAATGTFAWLAAGEGCTDGGNNSTDKEAVIDYGTDDGSGKYTCQNTGIAFGHPVILKDDGAKTASEGRTTGPEIPLLSGTYAVRDNVIRIEFVRNTSVNTNGIVSGIEQKKATALIENTNNEINKAISRFKFNDGTSAFTGAYIDAECTVSTDGKGDLAVIYIKASSKWNLDTTGVSIGSKSDASGTFHSTVYNDIYFKKIIAGVFATLYDNHKNRIADYSQTPYARPTPDHREGFRFTAVTSRCAVDEMHIVFTVADFGSNKVYVYFDDPLANDRINWGGKDATNPVTTESTIKIYSNISTSTSINVTDVDYNKLNDHGIILTLSQPLGYDMINYGIKVEYASGFQLSTKIQSTNNHVVNNGESHCISDVLTSKCIDVQYAYDDRNTTYIDSTGGVAPIESIVMRNFTEAGMNNKVFADKNITLVTKNLKPEDAKGNAASFSYKMIADITPTSGCEGTTYEANSGNKTRFWFPEGNSPVSGFAPYLNSSANKKNTSDNADLIETKSDPLDPDAVIYYFHNFSEETPCLDWQSGSNVRFLFEVMNGASPIMINHKFDGTSYNNGSQMTPLYLARLKDQTDPTSIDLWSFIIADPQRQRGNVSIFSNVVNATNKEFCTLEVNMARAGNLRVIVMTADGNVVQYLENGRQSEGLHYYYWHGTNNAGKAVARGIYFIRVVGPDIEETRKVMVVK